MMSQRSHEVLSFRSTFAEESAFEFMVASPT
jgi:hypothetical protein